MSTIFGIVQRNNKEIDKKAVEAMHIALNYWDADKQGTWFNESVFLGHQMLYSTAASVKEKLPSNLHFDHRNYIISMDGRLDNCQELADLLDIHQPSLDDILDSQLIVAAYNKWGEECPKYLLGDFVFVIWDESKKQLFCARDHVGIRSFYYYLSEDLFVFSNDIRGVIAHPDVPNEYSDKAIAMFLVDNFSFYDEQNTIFSNIKKLEAASSKTITATTALGSSYWSIDDISKVHYDTYDEYVENFRKLLDDAVKVRLRTTYPIASHLSGGLDSSSIAVLAARVLRKYGKKLYIFNWIETHQGTHDALCREGEFATRLARLEKMEQKQIHLTAEYLASLYDKVDISTDDISYHWSEYLVRDTAEQYNVRTILSGWGGDEFISYIGFGYISGLFYRGHILKALKYIYAQYKDINAKYIILRTIKRSFRALLYPFFYKYMDGYFRKDHLCEDVFKYINTDFLASCKKHRMKDNTFYPGVHAGQKAMYKSGHLLQRIEYWQASAFEKKIEYAYPLLDKRIIEFALSIPEDMYAYNKGYTRYFFRSVISDYLPHDIVWAKKSAEIEHEKVRMNLWYQSLIIWLSKHPIIKHNNNKYIDRTKLPQGIRGHCLNNSGNIGNNISEIKGTSLYKSILVSNLKSKKP